MTNNIRMVSIIFIGFLFFAILGVSWTLIDGQLALELKSSDFRTLVPLRYGLILSLLGLLLGYKYILKSVMSVPLILMLLIFWLLLSCFWAIEPVVSLYDTVLFATMVVSVFYVIKALGADSSEVLLWRISSAILLVSFLVSVLGSPYGLMGGYHEGLWRGIFGHKNHFGVFLSVYIVWSIFSQRVASRPIRYIYISIALICLYHAGSAAAYILSVAGIFSGIFAFILCSAKLSRDLQFLIAFCCLAVGAFSVYLILPQLVNLVDRDLTLTGRTLLWGPAFSEAVDQFWGFGYGSNGGTEVLYLMRSASGWLVAPSTHNGYLSLLLDGGFIAVMLWIVWLLYLGVSALLANHIPTRDKSAILGVLIVVALNGFVDSSGAAYPTYSVIVLLLISSKNSYFRFDQKN